MRFQEALDRLQGQYDKFAISVVPTLAEVIYAPKGKKVTCPVHGIPRKFNVHPQFANNGKWYSYIEQDAKHGVFHLIRWVSGMSASEVLQRAREYLGGSEVVSHAEIKRINEEYLRKLKEDLLKNKASNNWLWSRSEDCPISIRGYFRQVRRIENLRTPSNVRFNRKTFYRSDDGKTGRSSALIAKVDTPAGEGATLHRIYLEGNLSKSPIGKKMMPPSRPVMGGACRLYPVRDGVLGIAEGIETAVAVTSFFNIPTWAAISASMMAGFVPPKEVRVLVIWVDKDRSEAGEKAAKQLKSRAEEMGIDVLYALPPAEIPVGKKSVDWLDICYPTF